MAVKQETKVALVQRPPLLLDGEGTLQAAISSLHEAAEVGAKLIVFPETYLPGYPVWIWRLRPGADFGLAQEIHGRLMAESIDLDAGDLKPLQDAAAERGVFVVVGVHEREGSFSGGTLYNALVTIGPDGAILNRHRKLVPTNPERMVWGQGDGSGLRVARTGIGRLGGLICWENYMPLARFALYAEGVEIYVASTWDSGDGWLSTMRHIASEGRCWVLGSGCAIRASDIPADFPGRADLFPDADEVLNPGDSVVVSPSGQVVAGPLHDRHEIVYADIDVEESARQHRTMDVAGHYGRSDVFRLTIDRTRRVPVIFTED
jgi:nitrilase